MARVIHKTGEFEHLFIEFKSLRR